jgi:undecaprenyl-diphosphatase
MRKRIRITHHVSRFTLYEDSYRLGLSHQNITVRKEAFMSLFHALILGIVQGLTEYIPISSSGHLVLVPWLLGWPDSSFTFEVLVQWGTLVGVFVYFWRDLWDITRSVVVGLAQRRPLATAPARMGWYIVLGTIPAAVFGSLLKDFFEATFSAPVATAAQLLGTAAILIAAERLGRQERTTGDLGWLDALIVGLWQVISLFPGISRSGATIGGAMFRGFDRPAAARFSFLLSVPALLGAGIWVIGGLLKAGTLEADLPAVAVGFIAAAISGYLCIRWLLGYLQRRSLTVFAVYCVLFGILNLAIAWMRG